MKKILILFFFCISFLTSAQVEKEQIKYAKFALAANYETLKKKGGIYAALVVDMKFYLVNKYSNDSLFEYIIPSGSGGENLVDFVTVNPSRTYNRSVSLGGYDGIFLDPNNINHIIVRIKSIGKEYILGCGNEIPYRKIYVINIPHSPTVTFQKKPCNCPNDTNIILPPKRDNEGIITLNNTYFDENPNYGIPLADKKPNYNFNQKLNLTTCQLFWIKKYPEAYKLWLHMRNRKAFNKFNIPYGPDRRKMRRCFEGPSVLRVAGIIIGTGGVATGGYVLIRGNSSKGGSSPNENWDGNPTSEVFRGFVIPLGL